MLHWSTADVNDPFVFLYYRKLYHVRPVTQGDVYRAEAKDIPRIFQVRGCYKLQLNFNGSNTFGTVNVCSK